MTHKKIFILMGNPYMETHSCRMANAYEEGALSAGHEVRRMNIGEMQFDPILHKGYHAIQALEPDLLTFQANVKWCDHFVVVYPNWWCSMPAILKGLFDRAWIPGFAFNFKKSGMGWVQRMKGKSARVLISGNTHPWVTWFFFGEFTNELARGILGFSGFSPVRVKVFAPAEKVSETRIAWWLHRIKQMGKAAR